MKIFEKLGDWWLDFHGGDREEAHNQWLILKWSVIGLLVLTGAWVWFEALKKDWLWLIFPAVAIIFGGIFLMLWLWEKIGETRFGEQIGKLSEDHLAPFVFLSVIILGIVSTIWMIATLIFGE